MSAGGLIAIAEISLTDRLRAVKALLVNKAILPTDKILLGAQYAELEGNPRRIVFVPSGATPSTAPLEMSNKEGGSNQWECTAHIWAKNDDDDYGFEQFADLETVITELQGALRIVAGGRFSMSTIEFSNDTQVLKYGENARFRFSFKVNYQMVPAMENLPLGPTTVNAVARTSS